MTGGTWWVHPSTPVLEREALARHEGATTIQCCTDVAGVDGGTVSGQRRVEVTG